MDTSEKTFPENFCSGQVTGYILVLPKYTAGGTPAWGIPIPSGFAESTFFAAGGTPAWGIPIQKYDDKSTCVVVHESRINAEADLLRVSQNFKLRITTITYKEVVNYSQLMDTSEDWRVDLLIIGKDGKMTHVNLTHSAN